MGGHLQRKGKEDEANESEERRWWKEGRKEGRTMGIRKGEFVKRGRERDTKDEGKRRRWESRDGKEQDT